MNELQIIDQREVLDKQLKIYGDFENPLFLAKDVAEWIDYSESNVSKLVNMVDESEKVRNIITTLGGNQEMWFLTEDGLYEVLMQSRKPIAKQFKAEVKKILKSIRKTGTYTAPKPSEKDKVKAKRLEIQEKNARIRASQTYLRIAANSALPETYKKVLLAYATNELSGGNLLPLPEAERKTYSATEIGKLFGISANKVGKIANENGLKTPEYGQLYHDKSRYSSKEVDTFRYYDSVIPKIEEVTGLNPTKIQHLFVTTHSNN